MAISVDWGTSVITVPQADLTFISGSLYELDVDVFRLALKDLEDDFGGMPFTKTHNHFTEITLSGVVYARTVQVIPPYTVEFEDGQYVVRCVGANHNLADRKVANQVSLIIGNAAGLVVSGSGVTAQDKLDIADQVWDEIRDDHVIIGSYGEGFTTVLKGTVDSTSFTPTTTQFEASDITEATTDHYKDRVIIFTSGDLKHQAKAISGYSLQGGKGRFTVGTLTEAPSHNNTFIIV